MLNDGALIMGCGDFKVNIHRFQIIIATQETHITLTRAPQENPMTGVLRFKQQLRLKNTNWLNIIMWSFSQLGFQQRLSKLKF